MKDKKIIFTRDKNKKTIFNNFLIIISGVLFRKKVDRFIFFLLSLGFDDAFCTYALEYYYKFSNEKSKSIIARVLGFPYVINKLSDLELW